MSYDSTQDTLDHIGKVKSYLEGFSSRLQLRGHVHDLSKLKDPEKSLFDKYTTMLKELTYGSEEYKRCLEELKPALDHHYSRNSHHPEYYSNGVSGFDLLDLIEMFFDWKAASERHSDGDILKSIEVNSKRFNLDPQIVSIFVNTAKRFWK